MIIKTNLSWNTLANYSAMMWNNGEEPYCIGGDAFLDCLDSDGEELLDLDYLKSDCEWQIEKHFTMLEEDFVATCHQDYLEGHRDSETVKGNNQYTQYRKEANAFKRQYRKWLESVEVVEEWTFDTDIDEFISFPSTANGKAVAILH